MLLNFLCFTNNIYKYISRKRFKPTVRVTYHDENGNSEREEIDLSALLAMEQEVNHQEISEPADPPQVSDSELANDDDLDGDVAEHNECPSLYYQKVERKQKAWEDLRELTSGPTNYCPRLPGNYPRLPGNYPRLPGNYSRLPGNCPPKKY